MKNEKGITLIALIITIIVMIILVGVTINIAINGGLFEQAGDAARRQEEQTIYEQIIGMTVWNEDGTINMAETYLAVKNAFGENNVSELAADGTFTVTGKHGEYKYKIKEHEISIITPEEQGGDSHLTVSATIKNKKINSATIEITASRSFSDAEGMKYLCKMLNIPENSSYEEFDLAYVNMMLEEGGEATLKSFKELQEFAASNGFKENVSGEELFNAFFGGMTTGQVASRIYMGESEKILKINNEETLNNIDSNGKAEYTVDKNGEYNIAVTIGNEIATCKITVEGINEIVGKYVQIDGSNELWVVLYDENEKTQGAQLISLNPIGEGVDILAFDNSVIDWSNSDVIAETDLFDDAGIWINNGNTYKAQQVLSNYEKAVYTYNHAIENLNRACAETVGDLPKVTDIRCVGSNPADKNNETNRISTFLLSETVWYTKWVEYNTEQAEQYNLSTDIVNPGTENATAYQSDTNYESDYNRLQDLNILNAQDSYHLASRDYYYNEGDNTYNFKVRAVPLYQGNKHAISESARGGGGADTSKNKLRPVLILEPGVLSSIINTGAGTQEDPLRLQ